MFNLQQFLNKRKKDMTEEDLIRVHHILMKIYGWIPLKEFRSLPTPTIINLLGCIQEDEKENNKPIKGRR